MGWDVRLNMRRSPNQVKLSGSHHGGPKGLYVSMRTSGVASKASLQDLQTRASRQAVGSAPWTQASWKICGWEVEVEGDVGGGRCCVLWREVARVRVVVRVCVRVCGGVLMCVRVRSSGTRMYVWLCWHAHVCWLSAQVTICVYACACACACVRVCSPHGCTRPCDCPNTCLMLQHLSHQLQLVKHYPNPPHPKVPLIPGPRCSKAGHLQHLPAPVLLPGLRQTCPSADASAAAPAFRRHRFGYRCWCIRPPPHLLTFQPAAAASGASAAAAVVEAQLSAGAAWHGLAACCCWACWRCVLIF